MLLAPEEEEGAAPPRASCAATLLVGLLIVFGALAALSLQLLVALFTWPCLLCQGGRDRFHHFQSRVYRGTLSCVVVGLNPLWCTETHWVGSVAGPPDILPGSVIFCNHRSNADPFLTSWLLFLSGIEARYIYKSSLRKVPVLGCCCMLAGDLPVRFGDKQQILQMLERSRHLLERGYHLVVFPEGTRSPSGILQDFKPSFFEICAELGCPAVPACILGSERAWPHRGLRMGCAKVHLAIGEPLMAGQGGARALALELAGRLQEMACEVLGSADNDGEMAQDPLVTGRPYPYWRPPPELEGLTATERLRVLRAGQGHERGTRLL